MAVDAARSLRREGLVDDLVTGWSQSERPALASAHAPEPPDGSGPLLTRAGVLKAAGATAAATLLPLDLLGTAEANPGRDCYQPCLGITSEAYSRALKSCAPRPTDFVVGYLLSSGLQRSIWSIAHYAQRLADEHEECAKPGCGNLGSTIRKGGSLHTVPVPPLDLPAGTAGECENCQSVGGYCGVCPTGTVSKDQQFFCSPPGVPPCRYCAGC